MISKERVVPGRESQDLTQFVNKLTIGKPYEVVNYKETRNLNGDSAVLTDVVNVLCTIIRDLKETGIIREK